MQQKSKMQNKDFKPSDERFEVTVEHAGSALTASSAEGASQISAVSFPEQACPLFWVGNFPLAFFHSG